MKESNRRMVIDIDFYINDWEKEHVKNLLKWLIEESISAGGDGDAWWYSRNYLVRRILPIVEELNKEYKWGISSGEHFISWSRNQESVYIVDTKEEYKNFPEWAQVVVRW